MYSVFTWEIKTDPVSIFLFILILIRSKLILGGADEDLYVGDLHYHRVVD